jgi:hypothetical protein
VLDKRRFYVNVKLGFSWAGRTGGKWAKKVDERDWVWWYTPVNPATQEVEVAGLWFEVNSDKA